MGEKESQKPGYDEAAYREDFEHWQYTIIHDDVYPEPSPPDIDDYRLDHVGRDGELR